MIDFKNITPYFSFLEENILHLSGLSGSSITLTHDRQRSSRTGFFKKIRMDHQALFRLPL
jgi:hypothetical protein